MGGKSDLDMINSMQKGTNGYRFLPPSVAKKYDLDVPDYQGDEQIVETAPTGRKAKSEKVLKMAERQDL